MDDMDPAKVQFITEPVQILQLKHLSGTNKCLIIVNHFQYVNRNC